jgi:hypothetical protein
MILLPVVFGLWANLDVSFLVGLVFLGLLLIGRVLEGKPAGRLALVAGLCAAAVCINPYGPRLISAAIAVVRVHLQFAIDWQPPVSPRLPQMSVAAWAVAASTVLVFVTLRLSPKRFSPADVLLLLVFGIATWFTGRLLPWWLMVCGWVLLPHWTQICIGWVESSRPTDQAEIQAPGSLVSLKTLTHATWKHWPLIMGIALVVAGILVHDAARSFGREQTGTPKELSEHLQRQVSERHARKLATLATSAVGLMGGTPEAAPLLTASALVITTTDIRVFAPIYWSDYLLWQLPATGQLFIHSRIDVFRSDQLDKYNRILTMRTGSQDWRTLLGRAGVDVVALSATGPGNDLFAHFLSNQESGWQLAYVNDEATELIAVRER